MRGFNTPLRQPPEVVSAIKLRAPFLCHVCSITSSQGSQEVRVSRYRYDPVLKILGTESEVFSSMEDTASGTQVQVCYTAPL